jgi:serine/threonine protein kinase
MIRHPFILSIDRIEVVDGRLVIVMELADQSLSQLREERQLAGKPGIGRDELLHYLGEAAEALDLMSFQHGLQHLDVKPHNLFLVSNHIKVADFGLVYSLQELSATKAAQRPAGFSVLYAAPETLRNSVSRHSDQYSLAIVYQELLTGTLPFQGKSANHLMIQHISAEPDLSPLPETDRATVRRALSKNPDERFPSCLEFLQALTSGGEASVPGSAAPPRLKTTKIFKTLSDLPKNRAQAIHRSRSSEGVRPNSLNALKEIEAPSAASSLPAGCLELANLRIVEVLAQDSLGEVYLVEAPDGSQRLARLLPCGDERGAESRIRFGRIRHPVLVPSEFVPIPAGGTMLVTDLISETLADRSRECSAEGAPGVLREELLDFLGTVAGCLDQLYEEHGLRHLKLSPRALVIEEGRARLTDFGLVELFWSSPRQSAAAFNRRYGDPHLDFDENCPSADQYSLALIYAEMLTRVHPSPLRLKARSGGRSVAPINLDFLPVTDRDVIARALNSDPRQRFRNCTEMVNALGAACRQPATVFEEKHLALPAVLRIEDLVNRNWSSQTAVPSVRELLTELLGSAADTKPNGVRAEFHSADKSLKALERSFLIESLPASILRLKLDGFRMEWGAQFVGGDDSSLTYHLDAPRTFWQRRRGQQAGLKVSVILDPLPDKKTKLTRAKVQIRALDEGKEGRRMLAELGPGMFKSIFSFLQVAPDARAAARQALREPLHAYPVLPGLNLAPSIQGLGRDFSRDGIGFVLPQEPPTELLYIHLPATRPLAPYALLTHLRWIKPADGGWFRVGALFELESPVNPTLHDLAIDEHE